MYKETITYTDYNGKERSEDFFFNLTKAEIIEMEVGVVGGLTGSLQRAIAAQDQPTIFKVFKDLILKAYGEKSPDGRQFMKNDEIRTRFEQTAAFSDLLTKLAFDDDAASKFVNSIMPQDLVAEIAKNPNGEILNLPTNN